jgi:hypothetical protein
MKHSLGVLCVAFSFVYCFAALTACTTDEPPVVTTSPIPDPLSGSWTGDWGPTPEHRNNVTLALNWNGTDLSGTINPGPDAIPITRGTFSPDTGLLTLEATSNGRGNGPVRYTVEGKLTDATITGTWTHDDKKGDFKVAKS